MDRSALYCMKERIQQKAKKTENLKKILIEMDTKIQEELNRLMIEEMQLRSIKARLEEERLVRRNRKSIDISTVSTSMASNSLETEMEEELNLKLNEIFPVNKEFVNQLVEEEDEDGNDVPVNNTYPLTQIFNSNKVNISLNNTGEGGEEKVNFLLPKIEPEKRVEEMKIFQELLEYTAQSNKTLEETDDNIMFTEETKKSLESAVTSIKVGNTDLNFDKEKTKIEPEFVPEIHTSQELLACNAQVKKMENSECDIIKSESDATVCTVKDEKMDSSEEGMHNLEEDNDGSSDSFTDISENERMETSECDIIKSESDATVCTVKDEKMDSSEEGMHNLEEDNDDSNDCFTDISENERSDTSNSITDCESDIGDDSDIEDNIF